MNVAVFCSSSENVSPMFLSEIERLGENLVMAGHAVVYGGATAGCMGALARGVLSKKGRLIGVVPRMDFIEGLVQPGLSELHEVTSFSDRKCKMIELADAFIVYPGGIGTLDEAFEVLALKSIGTLPKPILFYNFLDAWNPLLECMEVLVQNRMIRQNLSELLTVVDKHEILIESCRHVV